MNNSKSNTQSGKSVMELMIVLVVVIILVTIAVAQFGNSTENLDRQNIAREFKVSLERARFDSVKRRATDCTDMSRVTMTSATSFTMVTDLNQNGTIEPTLESRVIDFSSRSDVAIVGDDLGFPVTVRFDRRGNVSSGPCSAPVYSASRVIFCNLPCNAGSAGAANSNIVFVSATGTAAMMRGGETIPTFSDPSVTAVDSNSQVNPLLSVWDATVVATPSPSPDPSATPIETPTPTPTPTPSVTPTPTPVPVSCTYGERPGDTGCTCVSPMWVRSNGKCQ